MKRIAVLGVGLSLSMLVGCSGGSLVEFRPAKNAKEFPATKAAYRVNEPPFCDSIGVIHADGPHPIEEISELAAAHGGTHYIVRSDRSKEHYETTGFITSGLLVAQTEKVVDRHVWVQVFRCDS